MLNIQAIQNAGGFVSATLIKKNISYEIRGEKFDASIFIRELGIEEWGRLFTSEDIKERSMAAGLAAVIRLGENGEESLTVDQVASLHPSLGLAMLKAAKEVNSPKENSPTETDS